MAKIIIDKNKCIGCETCSSLCPKLFEVIGGKSRAKLKEVKEKDLECAKKAESACPEGAIKIVE